MDKKLLKKLKTWDRVDGNRITLSMNDMLQTYPNVHEKLKSCHAIATMQPGSILYGSGATITMLADEDEQHMPKYFALLWPFEKLDKSKLGLIPVSTDSMLGEQAYLGAMCTVMQHITSEHAHMNSTMSAEFMRITDIDSSVFKNAQGDVLINTTENILEGVRPMHAHMAMKGGTADTGRWLARMFAYASPAYVLGTLQNYIQFGIEVRLEDILEVIRVIKRQFMLGEDGVTPGIEVNDTFVDWRDVLKRAPLLRGIRY